MVCDVRTKAITGPVIGNKDLECAFIVLLGEGSELFVDVIHCIERGDHHRD